MIEINGGTESVRIAKNELRETRERRCSRAQQDVHGRRERLVVNRPLELETLSEAHALDLEIVSQEAQLFTERDLLGAVRVEAPAQQLPELPVQERAVVVVGPEGDHQAERAVGRGDRGVERTGAELPLGRPHLGRGAPVFLTEWPGPLAALAACRAINVLAAVVLLVLAMPLLLVIAVLVKLSSRGPVFYTQTRVGLDRRVYRTGSGGSVRRRVDYGGRLFTIYKFRTMRADPSSEAQVWASPDDARVTRVGRVLRKYRLDELPQLWNVLRGEMSLVGPRPLPLRDFAQLEAWHRKRYLVLPGMTGLWQISGRSDLSFDDLVRLDFYYLDNWSIWLDISILLKTFPAVLARRGAY